MANPRTIPEPSPRTGQTVDPNVAPPIDIDSLNVADPAAPDPNAPTDYPRPDPETTDPRTEGDGESTPVSRR
jgi:hypothetical protein